MRRYITPHRLRQAVYAPLLATGMALMFARLLVMARLLDIEAFAALSAGLLVSSLVSTVACFGLYLDLQRKLPVHMVRRQSRAAAAALARTMIAALSVGVIGIVVSQTGVTLAGASSFILLLGVVHGVSQQLFLVVTTEARSNNEPLRYSVQHLLRSLASVVAGVAVALKFGDASLVLAAEAVVALASVAWIAAGASRRLAVGPLLAAVLALRSFRAVSWMSMLSLLAYSLVGALSAQLDRWLSSLMLEPESFAQYSFAWVIIIAALYGHALVNASAYPVMAQRFALAGAAGALRFASAISGGVLAVSLVASVPFVLVAGRLIRDHLPLYQEAIAVLPLLTAAAILRVSDFYSSFALIAGREKAMLALTIVGVAAASVFWYLVAGIHGVTLRSLAWLAVATAAASFLSGLAMALAVRRSLVSGPTGTAPRQ